MRLKEFLEPFLTHLKRDLEPFINKALTRTFESSGQMQLVVYSLARKTLKGFSSVVILGCRGHGEDAMLVTRSLIEATVTAAILEENPARADDFVSFFWIYEYRLLLELRDLDSSYAEEIFPRARAEEAERRFRELNGRFGISEKHPFRGQWHQSSMPKLIKALKCPEYLSLQGLYSLAYRKGSDVAHGTVIDLMERARKTPDRLEIDSGPSKNLVAAALASAHAALLIMLGVCNNALNLGLEEGINDLNRKHAELWPGATKGAGS